ncbi:MAG: isocitrate/isopropylmalate dehydrogenase family protein [Anaerolineae bacterium]|nr:MAG: isocitrate/isopropylmalate dehydrogenase family protein [Anaerolineae bacterium]
MNAQSPLTILLIPGDGVGAEVIPAAAEVLRALGLDLHFQQAEAGFGCFTRRGTALPEETLALARQADAILFGATASPSTRVDGYRSPILALRRALGLYANLRPVVSMPFEFSRPGVDLLVVRENSEGLYSGRERVETPDTAIAERLISRAASERIARLACELALRRAAERQRPPRLTVIHKANVLKLSDGLFRESALKVAAGYPDIAVEELLVDAAAMHLVRSPQRFDVLLAPNLYGDILSDEASALVGGLGFAPSANVGEGTPLFEPVHGSAPDIAGQGIANPTGAILSAALMLETLGLPAEAKRLRAGVQRTLAAGIRTPDAGGSATTQAFTQAVIASLSRF